MPKLKLNQSKRFLEPALLSAIGAVYFCLRLPGLRSEPINRLWDEGIWLALMKLVAEGKGELYRDFVVVHPPGVIWVGARLWNAVNGDIGTLRVIMVLFCTVACVPTYLMVRRLYGVRTALGTLLLLTVTPGFCTWLGRTVMLDLALHVPLYIALWLLVCPPQPYGRRVNGLIYPVAAGLLLGFGELIKETAITAGLAISCALFLSRYLASRCLLREELIDGATTNQYPTSNITDDQMHPLAWQGFTVAFLASFAIVTVLLSRIPNYFFYAFVLKTQDVRTTRSLPGELINGFYMLPLQMTFGAAGVVQMARSRSRTECFLGLFALVNTAVMIVVPGRFYWRYLMPGMPILTLGTILWLSRLRTRMQNCITFRTRAQVIMLVLFSLVGLVTTAAYFAHDRHSPPEYKAALRLLETGPGPVFTLDPIWIVASRQSIHPWRMAADPEFLLKNVRRPQAFTEALTACPTVLLNHVTLQQLPPETEAVARQQYRSILRFGRTDSREYIEILQRP